MKVLPVLKPLPVGVHFDPRSLRVDPIVFLAFGYGSNNPTIAISSKGPIIYFACDGNHNQSGELPFCDINVWYNLTITQVSFENWFISVFRCDFRFEKPFGTN